MQLKSVIIFLFTFFVGGKVLGAIQADTFYLSEIEKGDWAFVQEVVDIFIADRSANPTQVLDGSIDFTNHLENETSHWFYVEVQNDLNYPEFFAFLLNGSFSECEIYIIEDGRVKNVEKIGRGIPFSQRFSPENRDLFWLDLQPDQKITLLVKMYSTTKNYEETLDYLYFGNNMLLLSEIDLISAKRMPFLGISIAFQGAIGIMILFMVFLWVQNPKEKVYLYYSLYMAVAMFYLLLKIAHSGPFYFVLPDYHFLAKLLNDPLQYAIAITYNLFIVRFLKIKEHAPKLFKFMMTLNVIYALTTIILTGIVVYTSDFTVTKLLFVPSRLVFLLAGITTTIWALMSMKTPLLKYMVWGSSFFMLGSVAGAILSLDIYGFEMVFVQDLNLQPLNFTQAGILIEILFFSLGIGKLIQISNQEKAELKDAYIAQLEHNEQLSKTHSEQLETKVEERSAEIVAKTKELAEAKNVQQKLTFDRELMNREMRLLRLQMNPHFIFNSLNSIRYFILKQNEEKAIEYIESFSKLLRMILDYSKRDFISINEELSALKLYIKFEKERFNQKFDFKLSVDKEIDTSGLAIQPLLLQPFVENSIWHGLMHKTGKGCLTIDIRKTTQSEITITIEDNGIGREKSTELNARKVGKYKSHGLEITQSRIEMTSNGMNENYGLTIEDLYDENGKPTGTRVIFTIRIQKHEPLA